MMNNFNSTMKIKNVLTHEQKKLKAELFGDGPGKSNVDRATEKIGIKPELINALLVQELRKSKEIPSSVQALHFPAAREADNRSIERAIIHQQKEILQENQEILRQILKSQMQSQAAQTRLSLSPPLPSKTVPAYSARKITEIKAPKASDDLLKPVMEALKPLMQELRAVKEDLKFLKAKESQLEREENVSGERVLALAGEKRSLHNKMRDMRKKVSKIGQQFTSGLSDSGHQEFLSNLNRKVTEIEQGLLRDREALAQKAADIARKEQIDRQLEDIDSKIDFVADKAKIEARLGTDFSYKEYLESLGDLLSELSAEKLAFNTLKLNCAIPIASSIKFSPKELSNIARRAHPDISVLDLKKQQFGQKFSVFVASRYQSVVQDPSKIALIKEKALRKQASRNEERQAVTSKQGRLKDVPSKSRKAELDAVFSPVKVDNSNTIVFGKDAELARFKDHIKMLATNDDKNDDPKIKLALSPEILEQNPRRVYPVQNNFVDTPNDQYSLQNDESYIEKAAQNISKSKIFTKKSVIFNEQTEPVAGRGQPTRPILKEASASNNRSEIFVLNQREDARPIPAKEAGVMAFFNELVETLGTVDDKPQSQSRSQSPKHFPAHLGRIAERVVEKQLKWISQKEQEIKDYEKQRQAFKSSKEKIFKKIKEKSREKKQASINTNPQTLKTVDYELVEETGQQHMISFNRDRHITFNNGIEQPQINREDNKKNSEPLSSETLLNDIKQELETTARFPEGQQQRTFVPPFSAPDQRSQSESVIEDYCRQLTESSIKEEPLELSDFSIIDNYQSAILTPAEIQSIAPKPVQQPVFNPAQPPKANYKFVFKPKFN